MFMFNLSKAFPGVPRARREKPRGRATWQIGNPDLNSLWVWSLASQGEELRVVGFLRGGVWNRRGGMGWSFPTNSVNKEVSEFPCL